MQKYIFNYVLNNILYFDYKYIQIYSLILT